MQEVLQSHRAIFSKSLDTFLNRSPFRTRGIACIQGAIKAKVYLIFDGRQLNLVIGIVVVSALVVKMPSF